MWGRIGLLTLAGLMAISATVIGAPALADDAPIAANVTDVPTAPALPAGPESTPQDLPEAEPDATPAPESLIEPAVATVGPAAAETPATTNAVLRGAPSGIVVMAAISGLSFSPIDPVPGGFITVTGNGCDPFQAVLIRTSIPTMGASTYHEVTPTAAADGSFSAVTRVHGLAGDVPVVSPGTQFAVGAFCGGVETTDPDLAQSVFGILADPGTNEAPGALPDHFDTEYETAVSVPAPGMLINDSDPDGDPITAHLFTGPSNGTLTNLMEDGSFTYTPNPGFHGADTFLYYAYDGAESSSDTPVTINVLPPADPPVAVADSYTTAMDTPLDVSDVAAGLLANDSDPTGDPMRVCLATSTHPTHGTLTYPSNDGRFHYTPDVGFNGVDTWTYHAGDATHCGNFVTVTVTVGDVVADPDPDPAGSPGADSGDEGDDRALPDTGAGSAWTALIALIVLGAGSVALRFGRVRT